MRNNDAPLNSAPEGMLPAPASPFPEPHRSESTFSPLRSDDRKEARKERAKQKAADAKAAPTDSDGQPV